MDLLRSHGFLCAFSFDSERIVWYKYIQSTPVLFIPIMIHQFWYCQYEKINTSSFIFIYLFSVFLYFVYSCIPEHLFTFSSFLELLPVQIVSPVLSSNYFHSFEQRLNLFYCLLLIINVLDLFLKEIKGKSSVKRSVRCSLLHRRFFRRRDDR